MRSHLVSKVILKWFSNADGLITKYCLACGESSDKPYGDVGYIDVDTALIGELEQQWSSEVEAHGHAAINSLINGDVMLLDKQAVAIKKLIGLHFLRCQAFYLVEAEKHNIKATYDNIRREVLQQYPGTEAEIDNYIAAHSDPKNHDVAVRAAKDWLPKVQAFIDNPAIGFEIVKAPPSASFIISDNPVISAKGGKLTPIITEVGLTDASFFGMPLTPAHFVSLKTKPITKKKYRTLTTQQVEKLNSYQRQQAQHYYYSFPS